MSRRYGSAPEMAVDGRSLGVCAKHHHGGVSGLAVGIEFGVCSTTTSVGLACQSYFSAVTQSGRAIIPVAVDGASFFVPCLNCGLVLPGILSDSALSYFQTLCSEAVSAYVKSLTPIIAHSR